MALGSILKEFGVKLTLAFDADKVEKAKKSVAEIGKEMKGVAFQVAATSAAMFEFANLASSNSRALQQNSDALGINVERLQELEYAAKVAAGVSRDELMGALTGVSETLDKARHSDIMASEAFIRLGVPLQMITDKSVTADQVMLALADRLKSIQDPMARLRLATEVGLSPKFLPLIMKGSQGIAALGVEARKMGLVMSKDVIDKGAEFDRQFTKIWLVIKQITYTIGNELIKYLGPIVMMFQKWIIANRAFIATGIATVMKSIGTYLQIVFTVLKFVTDRFVALVKVLGGVGNASKIIAIAMGVITGAKILSAIGGLVSGFRAVAGVLGIISIESLAIGAGLLALILVVQDLFSSDSIIKEWINTFAVKFPNATKFLVGAFSVLKAELKAVMWYFSTLYGFIFKIVAAVVDFGEKAGIFKIIADAVSDIIEAFEALAGWAGKGLGAIGDFLSSHTSAAPSGGGSGFVGPPQKNTFNANVTVGVPAGTSPGAAVAIVGGGVGDAFNDTLRQTRNKAIGGVAY